MTDTQNDGELQRVEEYLKNNGIPSDAMSVAVEDGRPVIEIGATRIHLQVHYVDQQGDGSFTTVHDDVEGQWDADGDNQVWFTVWHDFDAAYVEIDPFVETSNEEVSADV